MPRQRRRGVPQRGDTDEQQRSTFGPSLAVKLPRRDRVPPFGFEGVIPAAAGVVVDVGAQQSHAAIVPRELGIPTVVSATGASTTIPDGATVTVNGSTGMVTVHP